MQITSIYHIHTSIQGQIKVQVSLGIWEVIEIYHWHPFWCGFYILIMEFYKDHYLC